MTAFKSADELVAHLAGRGIQDPRVLQALRQIPRSEFVPSELQEEAWNDSALPIGLRQTISQPMVVGWMTELLELQGGETVLEIGTGSGYQTAVLARLARRVVTLERHAELSKSAEGRLQALGITNVQYEIGDGSLGWPPRAPYDAILVTAGAPEMPRPLYDQLRMGGRLVLPIGDERQQDMQRIRKSETGPDVESHGGCRFVPLIGGAGWPAPPAT